MSQTQPRELRVSVETGPPRKLFRVSPSTWFVCQFVGSARLDMVVDGQIRTIELAQGEATVLPHGIPHRCTRERGAAALVCELARVDGEEIFEARCERCRSVIDEYSSGASPCAPVVDSEDGLQYLCDGCR